MARPTHKLSVKKKDGKYWSQIGAGWGSQWGINIKLNPCVTLTDRDDIYISLQPMQQRNQPRPDSHDFDDYGDLDEDVAF